MNKILIIDQNLDALNNETRLDDYLRSLGYDVSVCVNPNLSKFAMGVGEYDVALVDLGEPDTGKGMEVIRIIHDEDIDTVVIILTAYGTYEQAVEAINLGVFYWFDKNNLDLKLLADTIEDACRVVPRKLMQKWLKAIGG